MATKKKGTPTAAQTQRRAAAARSATVREQQPERPSYSEVVEDFNAHTAKVEQDKPFDVERFEESEQPRNRHSAILDTADRQRAQVHQAILNEADTVLDQAYQIGMESLTAKSADVVVATLTPYVIEAERIRATAERFAPIRRGRVDA